MTDDTPRAGLVREGAAGTFTLFAPNATRVDLCLVDPDQRQNCHAAEQHGDHWTVRCDHAPAGSRYWYHVEGPEGPGHAFRPDLPLLDPYARVVTTAENGACHGVIVDDTFDWQGVEPPRTPWRDTIIYEAHVKGLTQTHPLIPASERGRYLGVANPAIIEHLQAMGITALELLPIHQHMSEPSLAGRGLTNYWGYNTLGFFAPDSRYASGSRGEQVLEFKTMVRALHEAGIEVILDVVFNHTAEGDAAGPTLSFRGIDNQTYYRTDPDDPDGYADITGTGNTVSMRHPAVRRWFVDAVEYWVHEMHVDGFRLDLASALARDVDGPFRSLFESLSKRPSLADVKWIAEPWDATAEGYRLGAFPDGWGEWNDQFRDVTRRYWRGDPAQRRDLAARLTGSRDIFGDRSPWGSVNYVTSHDGFTLSDLVAYEHKHNLANGENNRDGADANWSSNAGVEGVTDDAAVTALRRERQRSLLTTLFVSLGVPMLSHGDELGRTQHGNNNAYCQDNETSWVSWLDADRALIAHVRSLTSLRAEGWFHANESDGATITWWGPDGTDLASEDWHDDERRCLGVRFELPDGRQTFVAFNAGTTDRNFILVGDQSGGNWSPRVGATDWDGEVFSLPACGAAVLTSA